MYFYLREIEIRLKSTFTVNRVLKITDKRTLKIVRKLKGYDVVLSLKLLFLIQETFIECI